MPSVTIPAGGRSIDQNGDGAIELTEGFRAAGAFAVRDQYDGYVQTSADMMQLVRVLQAGVDVDGDGAVDLDGSRITYWGHSNGSSYGIGLYTATPELDAAVFSGIGSPVLEHRRLSPIGREQVGAMLAARTPSLLNSAYGITQIDGVAMPPPFFNENQPLRGLAPVANTVPGAIAIQQVYERYAWAGRYADAAAHAPRVGARPVLIQWGRGDQRGAEPDDVGSAARRRRCRTGRSSSGSTCSSRRSTRRTRRSRWPSRATGGSARSRRCRCGRSSRRCRTRRRSSWRRAAPRSRRSPGRWRRTSSSPPRRSVTTSATSGETTLPGVGPRPRPYSSLF